MKVKLIKNKNNGLNELFRLYQPNIPRQQLAKPPDKAKSTSNPPARLQRLQIKKYLCKTTRIPFISGLVNIFDLRYSQPRCGKIRSRDLHPGYHNVDL
ncbi:hypothetical protein [Buttiauxella sp. A111]|uniref:hypothetical protein n=1 Tax=Buttiauxella sp. A111 TaxID=2563088 RepID=UPI001610F4FF|nr:hypothetical protein [Buttiauxella sp. A111]